MFVVYSKPACSHCEQAKSLLKTKGIDFEVVHLDVGQPKIDGEKYIARDELLLKVPGARTMPQIFKDEVPIGGFTELKALLLNAA